MQIPKALALYIAELRNVALALLVSLPFLLIAAHP